MRILSIGAFANGNLGDMYQADAIARLVKDAGVDAHVVSASPSKRGSRYPAQDHEAAAPGAVFDHDFINSFDVMLVGGGGLLSAPHAPLNDEAWIEGVKIPMVALSLGAAGDTPALSRSFIEKCASFSVRDDYSRAAVGDIRDDVQITFDPILMDAITHYDRAPRPDTSKPGKILWVPGKLTPGTRDTWAKVVGSEFNRFRDTLVSFNPETDVRSGFEDVFSRGIQYLHDIDSFFGEAGGARFVVSERYHAVIYSLAIGVPVVGIGMRSTIVSSKISELLRLIGHPDAMLFDSADMTRLNMRKVSERMDMDNIRTRLDAGRDDLLAYIRTSITSAL